jgi:glycosyltransferase involved in cell wall biosynthesis
MISVLIPTYNYNVYPLVKEVHKQLHKTGIDFEILVYDDASSTLYETHNLLKELSGVIYKRFNENAGRIANRIKLAQNARYSYLLFMDADVFPKDRFFIGKLLKQIEKNPADVYFGGINVAEQPPGKEKILRWKFGKYRENLPVSERINYPYRSILCGTICIKKDVFLSTAQTMKDIKRYGLDTYFSFLLKTNKRKIIHYHNPVTHLGLEKNSEFISKTKKAVETLRYLVNNRLIPETHIKLTHTAGKFSIFLPRFFCRLLFKSLKKLLYKQLNSSQASLFVFDVYKLLYYCQLN